jgi:NAD(P)-dependent dehydrogenase (short-subunit alcohol dehydrogenase family)
MSGSKGNTLAGQRVIVTGATRGLGRAMVEAFSQSGARVVVHGRTAPQAAAVAAGLGDGHVAVGGDLLDAALGGRLAKAAERGLGGLDALVLNAAVLGPMQALAETDFKAFREVMEVNVDAQLRIFVACLPALLASRGKVIWLTSGLGRIGVPRFGAYCASKHALEGLMKLAAVEHGPSGLTSVAVAPGMVRTEMLKAALLGGDVSGHTPPEVAGRGFARLLATLGPEHNGKSLDIEPWLA